MEIINEQNVALSISYTEKTVYLYVFTKYIQLALFIKYSLTATKFINT